MTLKLQKIHTCTNKIYPHCSHEQLQTNGMHAIATSLIKELKRKAAIYRLP